MNSLGDSGWRLRAIRGATTVTNNTVEAVRSAVDELLDALEAHNAVDPDQIVSVTFSVTPDIDAVFPAKIARQRSGWDTVPLLDVQHMQVEGSLSHCIRLLMHVYIPAIAPSVHHPYLRGASNLRPDWASSLSVSGHRQE
ncbi:MAG: chorismate mutase [Cyanobacteria bacterium J06554_6]